MWYLESWLWEQISWLKTGDWCCSLIMHSGRPGAGRVGGLAPSIQMGCFHVRNVLLGQWLSGKVSPAPLLAEHCDHQMWLQKQESALHWVGILCLLVRVLLSWRTTSQTNAWPSHGEFTLFLKCLPQQSKCCQFHLCKCSQQRPFDYRVSF